MKIKQNEKYVFTQMHINAFNILNNTLKERVSVAVTFLRRYEHVPVAFSIDMMW